MKVDVLLSCMNQDKPGSLAKKLGIKSGIVINQITKKSIKPINDNKETIKIFSYLEKGLSRSRNKAISHSKADVCLLADDDVFYVNNYQDIVLNAYNKYKDADLIAFHLISDDPSWRKKKLKEGRLGKFRIMKISSVQISLKRSSILSKKIKFDEKFGAGTENYMGEENIFLMDCYRAGLKIYYLPVLIARLKDSGKSTWFRGFDDKYFFVRGKTFKRMFPILWPMMILQFALRKYSIYRQQTSFLGSIKNMLQGANNG